MPASNLTTLQKFLDKGIIQISESDGQIALTLNLDDAAVAPVGGTVSATGEGATAVGERGVNVGGNVGGHIITGSVEGHVVGGDFITYLQFANGNLPAEINAEFFAQQLGINTKYSDKQFTTYTEIWQSLLSLQLAANDLWTIANENRLLVFTKRLRETQHLVQGNELYFDDNHFGELRELLEIFSNFSQGKQELIHLRSKQEISPYLLSSVSQMIAQNGVLKERYDLLFAGITDSFQKKLAAI
jgi:hypothetical protein